MADVDTTTTTVTTTAQPAVPGVRGRRTEDRTPRLTKEEHWAQKWRSLMAWQYMMVCIFDFILFPIGWSILQATFHGTITAQWAPLTLTSGGLYHLAMGAILGVAAFGKTQELKSGIVQ